MTGYVVEEVRRGAVDRHVRQDYKKARALLMELASQRWRRYDELRLVHVAGAKQRILERLPFGELPESEPARRRRLTEQEKLLHMRAADFLRRVLELKALRRAAYWRLAQMETPANVRHVGMQAFIARVRAEGIREQETLARLETPLIESAIAELEPSSDYAPEVIGAAL